MTQSYIFDESMRLERYAVKIARTVLRGGRGSNVTSLPDLLRALLICGECGYAMQGQTIKGYQSYYCCYGSKKRYEHVPHHSNRLSAAILESLVWEAVCQLLHDPQRIEMAWTNEAKSNQNNDQFADELSRLSRRQKQLDFQWQRLLDAYQDDLIDKEELSDRKQKLDQERQTAQERCDAIQQMQLKKTTQVQVIEAFSALCEKIQAALENPSPETKQEILRLLVEKIIVEEDTIIVKHIIPDVPEYRLSPLRLSRITSKFKRD